MDRRSVLRQVAAACLCPLCGSARAEDMGHAPHWGYEGEAGPDQWGKLASEYAACSIGREQSPVDLTKAVPALLGHPLPAWKPVRLQVLNNGHTIQVDCAGGGTVTVDGTAYDLLQFHFHHPSEHTVDGVTAAMEIHFVHRAAAGGLAVLGVLVRQGEANPALETIWKAMPAKAGEVTRLDTLFHPGTLLPTDSSTWRYAGSLTTPPCSEVVSWVVYRQAVAASAEQIARFATLFPNNARPVQPLNRRKLLLDAL